MRRTEYPLNQPFEHQGHEIVAVRAPKFFHVLDVYMGTER